MKSPTRHKTVQHKNFQFTTFEHSLVLSMSHVFINLHTQQKHPKVKQVWRKICWCKFNFYLTKWEEKKTTFWWWKIWDMHALHTKCEEDDISNFMGQLLWTFNVIMVFLNVFIATSREYSSLQNIITSQNLNGDIFREN